MDVQRAARPAYAPRGRRLRILHVVHRLGFAGTELGVVKLAQSLDRTRFASGIACCAGAEPALRRPAGVDVFEFDRPGHGNDWRLVVWLSRLCARERPDIVHTHGWATLCEGFAAAALSRVPVVVHGEHGTLETRPRNVRVQRWLWRRAAQVLAVSSCTAGRMARDIGFPIERIHPIHNGVDLHRFQPGNRTAARLALGLPPQALVVGTVGRLHPVKDHHTLLAAAAMLRARGLRFELVVAGDGPLQAPLRARARELGLNDVVHFLGNRPDAERVLRALDVFVLSSVSEGLPNSVLEAMATRLPVVATRVGGTAECVDDAATGLLVPGGEPDALCEALAALLGDAARRETMGLAGRQRVAALFSLQSMARKYETVYTHVAARARVG